MINLQSTRKPSFTLIELIVVITIIAVLVAIASVAYGGAQKNSRDARRIEDLNAIQKAMELAFDQGAPLPCTHISCQVCWYGGDMACSTN